MPHRLWPVLSLVAVITAAGLAFGSQPQEIVPAPGHSAAVAYGTEPVAAWTTLTEHGTRVAVAESGLNRSTILGPGGRGEDGAPALAAHPSGRVLAVAARWRRGQARLWAQEFDGKGWNRARWLRSAGSSDHNPAVATRGQSAWIAWVVTHGRREFVAAARWRNGTLSIPELLPSAPGKPGVPSIAIDASGQPVVVWSATDDSDTELWLTRRGTDGWGTLQQLTSNDVPDENPSLGVGANRRLILAWGSFTPDGYQPWAAMEDQGSFPRPRRLDDAAAGPPTAVGGAGNLVTWAAIHANSYELRAASTSEGRWNSPVAIGAVPSARIRLARREDRIIAAASNPGPWLAGGTMQPARDGRGYVPQLDLVPARQAANEDLPPLPGSYRAFGDSITLGIVRYNGVISVTPGYPASLASYIASYLGRDQVVLQNAGEGGETTAEGLGRLVRLNSSDPRAVTLIMEGANDAFARIAATTVEANLRAMVDNTRNAGSIAVLGTVTPRTQDRFGGTTNSIINEYNALIRPLAETRKALLVDQWAAFHRKPHLYSDLLHPTEEGYEYMAAVWLKALQPLFNSTLMGGDNGGAAAAVRARRSQKPDGRQ